MEEKNKNEEETKLEIKETLTEFVKNPIPELTQEEAIKAYRKDDTIKYKPKKNENDDENSENEDDEHLKRVKRELLDSLTRVEEMAKNIFKEEDKLKENLKNIKVKKSSGGGKGNSSKNQVLDQMRQIVQEDTERSREE